MKTVKTLAQATRLAASAGATMELGGRLINAGGARATVERVLPSAPPEPPPPAPNPLDGVAEIVQQQARVQAAQSQGIVDVMREVLNAMQRSTPAVAPRPLPTHFDIIRDDQGRIAQIVPVYGAAH